MFKSFLFVVGVWDIKEDSHSFHFSGNHVYLSINSCGEFTLSDCVCFFIVFISSLEPQTL